MMMGNSSGTSNVHVGLQSARNPLLFLLAASWATMMSSSLGRHDSPRLRGFTYPCWDSAFDKFQAMLGH